MATRPVCKYGASCYRKNPDHLKQFSHPGREKVQQGGDGDVGRNTTPSAAPGTSIEKGVTQSRNKAQRNAKVSDPSLQVIYNFLSRLIMSAHARGGLVPRLQYFSEWGLGTKLISAMLTAATEIVTLHVTLYTWQLLVWHGCGLPYLSHILQITWLR